MKKNNLQISLKLAKKELYHGWKHFSVFVACLILGVTVMAAVNTSGYIVKNSLKNEAQSLLGGDIEIRIRGVEATEEQKQFIKKYGKMSYVATLRSVIFEKDIHNLVEIKAVDDNYPLIGSIEFNEQISQKDVFSGNGIAVDKLLLAQIGLKIGDEIKVGSSSFVVKATLKKEPDRAVQIFSFGPRIMMSQQSLSTTGLVSTFALIDHRYRIKLANPLLIDENLEKQIESELLNKFPETSWRVTTGTDGNRTLRRFFEQLIAFMTLSGLATFLIAGIGIASAVRAYLEKKSQTIAVLKVNGAARSVVFMTYVLVIGGLSLVGGIIGVLISAGITTSLIPFIANFLPSLKSSNGIYLPASFLAIWYGILIAYLFSVPALFSAVNVRPSILFRSKTSILRFSKDKIVYLSVLIIASILLLTLFFNNEDKVFIAGTVIVFLFSFVLFWLCALAVRLTTKRIKVRKSWLKMALGNMHRPGSTTATVIFAIGISLTVLIALILTESNFQYRINQIIEERAPSLFLIDIQPQQKEELQEMLLEYTSKDNIMLYPMVRGRIVKIAGKPVEEVSVSEDVDWAVRGDRGLSYSLAPPKNANIIKGKWWEPDYKGEPLLSVDERFLKGMGMKIGDTMTVKILGSDITAKITSSREIDYSTFQLNFAMMFSPGVIESFPHTSLATVNLDGGSDEEFELVGKIARGFPGITTVRTKEVVQLVQNIMENIAVALRVTVAISLFAGLLVLTSALSVTINQRMYDVAILKVLGAKRIDILKSCSAEWMILAFVTSFIAASIGTTGAYLINSRLRGSDFYLMPHVTLTTIISCMIVIWIIGYIGNRRLFSFRPSSLLRNE